MFSTWPSVTPVTHDHLDNTNAHDHAILLHWRSKTVISYMDEFGKVNINKLESQVGLGSEATHDLRVSGGFSLFLFSPPNNSQCTNYNILGETQQYQATITSAQQWLLSISLLNKDILILRKKKCIFYNTRKHAIQTLENRFQ